VIEWTSSSFKMCKNIWNNSLKMKQNKKRMLYVQYLHIFKAKSNCTYDRYLKQKSDYTYEKWSKIWLYIVVLHSSTIKLNPYSRKPFFVLPTLHIQWWEFNFMISWYLWPTCYISMSFPLQFLISFTVDIDSLLFVCS